MFDARFSPDGHLLAVGNDRDITLWRCGSWEQLQTHLPESRLLDFSPDGQWLAMLRGPSYSTEMRIYDASGFTLKQSTLSWYPVQDIAFAPDGRTIATLVDGTRGTEIQFSTPQTNDWIRQINWEENILRGLSYSPDGRLIASATRDGTLHFWDSDRFLHRGAFRGTANRITHFQYSPDGRFLATSTDHGSVSLWNPALLTNPSPINDRFLACAGHLVRNPKRDQFAVANPDRSVSQIDAVTGHLELRLVGNLEHVEDMTFSPDGERFATVDRRHVRCWDTATGRQVWRTEEPGGSSVSWSPLGLILATGNFDHQIRLYDATSGHQTAVLKGHSDKLTMLRFFPDGKRLASSGYDNVVRVWDVDQRREARAPIENLVPTFLLKVPTLKVPILSLAIAPDGRQLAAGLALGNLILWDFDGDKPPRRHDVTWIGRYSPWNANQPPVMIYSPDSSIPGNGPAPEESFELSTARRGETVFSLEGRGVAPTSAAWMADPSVLATVTDSNEVTLWNTKSLARSGGVFGGPLSVICGLAFSGDGSDSGCGDPIAPPDCNRCDRMKLTARPICVYRSPPPSPRPSHSHDGLYSVAVDDRFTAFWEVGSTIAEKSLLDPLPTAHVFAKCRLVAREPSSRCRQSRDGSVWVWDIHFHPQAARPPLPRPTNSPGDGRITHAKSGPPLVAQEVLSDDATAPAVGIFFQTVRI